MNKRQLFQGYGAEVKGDVVVLYRGADVAPETILQLRYGDYLSAAAQGSDATGNEGAAAYGRHVERFELSLDHVEVTGAGEFRYVGPSKSLEGGQKYPPEIYKAYCDYHGHQFSAADIDVETDVRACASQALSGGCDEFDSLLANFRFARSRDSSVMAALENARDFIDDNLVHADAQRLGFVELLGLLKDALKGVKTYESLQRAHDALVDLGAGPINDLRVAKSRLLYPEKTLGEVRRADPAYEIWRVEGKLDSAYFTRRHMRDALDVHCDATGPLSAFGVDRSAGRLHVSFAGKTELIKRRSDQAMFFAQTPACAAAMAEMQPSHEGFARQHGWDSDGESIFRPDPLREGALQDVDGWTVAAAISRGEQGIAQSMEELLSIWLTQPPAAKSPYALYGHPPMWRILRDKNDPELVLFARPGKTMVRPQPHMPCVEVDGVCYQWQRDGQWVGQGYSTTFEEFERKGPTPLSDYELGRDRYMTSRRDARALADKGLTAPQAQALLGFSQREGRYWRSELGRLWRNEEALKAAPDGALLRQVREVFGAGWLDNVRLSQIRSALPVRVEEVGASAAP